MFYSITYLLYFLFIIIAFLSSLTAYSSNNKIGYLKYFPPFLLLTIFVEITAYIVALKYGNNQFLFNFFTVIGFSFYFFILHKGVKNLLAKKMVLMGMFLYAFYALYSIFFIQGIFIFNSISFGIGTLLLILICIYYFRWQFFTTPIEQDIKRDPLVFICLGLTVFHSISFTYFCGVHIFKSFSPSFIQNMTLICMISNYALYSFFTVAFLINYKYSKIEPAKFHEIPKP